MRKKNEIVFFGLKIDFLRVPRGKYIARMINIPIFDQIMIAGVAENITEKICFEKKPTFLC